MDKKKNNEPFGYHLMLDLYGCDAKNIDSLDYCYKFLDELPGKINMDKQSPPYIFRSPEKYSGKAGLSGWVPIIQSGISIHTLTDTGFISIDVYSCRKFEKEKVIEEVSKYFAHKKAEVQYVERGKDYY